MVDLHVKDEKEEFDLIDPGSLEPPFSFSFRSSSRTSTSSENSTIGRRTHFPWLDWLTVLGEGLSIGRDPTGPKVSAAFHPPHGPSFAYLPNGVSPQEQPLISRVDVCDLAFGSAPSLIVTSWHLLPKVPWRNA